MVIGDDAVAGSPLAPAGGKIVDFLPRKFFDTSCCLGDLFDAGEAVAYGRVIPRRADLIDVVDRVKAELGDITGRRERLSAMGGQLRAQGEPNKLLGAQYTNRISARMVGGTTNVPWV